MSALLGSSVNRSIRNALADGRFTLITSGRQLAELITVFSRPELSLEADAITEFMSLLLEKAEVPPSRTKVTDCRDPKDNMILEAAVDGRATHLVTGDADLHVLNPFRGIVIVTPARFLGVIREG
ncbi:MAG: putative toxin-antitoxin system toxin component, PIN family [bacterium]